VARRMTVLAGDLAETITDGATAAVSVGRLRWSVQ